MQDAAQYNLTGVIRYGGCSFLFGWFLLFFSGEIWGLDFTHAAELVMVLSLVSIASCFLSLIVLNFVSKSREIFDRKTRSLFLLMGALLSLGTLSIVLANQLPFLALIVGCVIVGICGAFFICATILQLTRLQPRNILMACGGMFLVGILVYSFAFYVPSVLTIIILCVLPFIAGLFYFFDKDEGDGQLQSYIGSDVRIPWSTVVLLSVFMLFSCVARGYLPFFIDNEFFSYLRSFSIVAMLIMAAVAVVVPAVLPERIRLSNFCRIVFIVGVVLFALFPIFGMDNPVVLVVEDGFRGLCALMTLALFACMARQIPFFGFKNVCGAVSIFIAAALIGWGVGSFLHEANFDSNVLRIYSSVQCVIVLLAFIVLYRQAEIERFVEAPSLAKEFSVPTTELMEENRDSQENGKGKWKLRMAALAQNRGLTAREEEVFLLLAKGYKAQNISDKLTISYNTTRAHIRNIYQKCDVHSQQEFIEFIEKTDKENLSVF